MSISLFGGRILLWKQVKNSTPEQSVITLDWEEMPSDSDVLRRLLPWCQQPSYSLESMGVVWTASGLNFTPGYNGS